VHLTQRGFKEHASYLEGKPAHGLGTSTATNGLIFACGKTTNKHDIKHKNSKADMAGRCTVGKCIVASRRASRRGLL